MRDLGRNSIATSSRYRIEHDKAVTFLSGGEAVRFRVEHSNCYARNIKAQGEALTRGHSR